MSDPNVITAYEQPQAGQPAQPKGLSFLGKLRWGVKNPPAPVSVSFAGKTVLVTGANTGLGFAAAVHYSTLGAEKLILGVRTAAKGDDAKARILARTAAAGKARDPDSIVVLTVDLTTFESVQSFASALEAEVSASGLDIALLAAGMLPTSFRRAPSGHEMALQVNVLSTALMALHVVPLLRAAARKFPGRGRPHLTFVNSNANDLAKKEWVTKYDNRLVAMLDNPAAWDLFRMYCLVKAVGLSVMQAVARATEGEIIVNAVCPGMCKTDIARDNPWYARWVGNAVAPLIMRSAEQGGQALVAATALGPESHGRFWHLDILFPVGELAQDRELMDRTWSEILDAIPEAPKL